MYSDTIAAIATPPGEGGIAVVRLSGPASPHILSRIFTTPHGNTPHPDTFTSHLLHFGHIIDPHSGDKIDEVLAVLMRAPHSYTREDVVEISCHGGPVPVHQLLALCLREGARLAQPGEFTLRAFLNGRLDLAQAEAVLDVVQARTPAGLHLAVEQLGGGLSARVKSIRARLLHALAHLEANIDFPEDDVPPADVSPDLRASLTDLRALISSAATGIVMRQGVRTALVGRPNTGKSSLLNALLRTERAIVTPIPGTTRDTLEEVANVRGVPLILTDTAGLRAHNETADPVERIGMERTRRALSEAGLVLLVLDSSQPLTPADLTIITEVKSSGAGAKIIILNKNDLPPAITPETITGVAGGMDILSASSLTPGGTDLLEDHLASLVLSGKALPAPGETAVTNTRHLDSLRRAEEHVTSALASTEESAPAALTAVDLHSALIALGEITGETVTEDLLDEIFRNFCIGK